MLVQFFRNLQLPRFALLVFLMSCGTGNKTDDKSASDSSGLALVSTNSVKALAAEAFEFAIPLVLMDISRRQATNKGPGAMYAPLNSFKNRNSFPDETFREVVRPNADTYYSSAWLDLKPEPIVLEVPDTRGRYYMMPMLDAYTNIFASPGSRTTGTKAAKFLIAGPGWKGELPAGMQLISAPTNMVWMIGRTQVNSKADGDKVVVPIQRELQLSPLSQFGKKYLAPEITDPNVPQGSPNDIVRDMSIDSFFNYLNLLMLDNPPGSQDAEILTRIASIGVAPGANFTLSRFSASEQEALQNIPEDFIKANGTITGGASGPVNGWSAIGKNYGKFGTDYTTRAKVSYNGLGANLPEDAVYPSCYVDEQGQQLNGANAYVLHFDKGQTPPAKAFWSLTMYDPGGYMVSNPIHRNAIGDRSKLMRNADGSIDVFIQHDRPARDKAANWLPAPPGDFNILLRVYWPDSTVLNGNWHVPPVKKI